MGMYKKIDNNTLQKLAGYTVIADGSCAEVRKGAWSISMPATPSLYQTTVTFTDPMPDTDYAVILEMNDYTYGGTVNVQLMVFDKTTTGFKIKTHISPTSAGAISGVFTAIKLIPMEGYTELKNKVDNPDTTPTENSTNLCTSGGIYDFVKNASSIFVGTSTEWAAATQTDYDIAVITDEHKILSIDKTAGTTAEQANLNKIFRGTLAEWEALTQTEKDYYDQAEIDDGPAVETSLLEKIYCVGSVYINTVDINPATIFGFGTWQRVASNMALWGASADGQAGTTKAAGLPNITGSINIGSPGTGSYGGVFADSGDIQASAIFSHNWTPSTTQWAHLDFNASKSNPIFGASTTVQPPALVVNVWRRTA